MAKLSLTATVGTALTSSIGRSAEPSAAIAAVVAAAVAVTADVATLVADGASPTQAHVTTLNTDYTVLAAAIAAMPAVSGDIFLNVNGANVLTINKYDEIMRSFRSLVGGSNVLTGLYQV